MAASPQKAHPEGAGTNEVKLDDRQAASFFMEEPTNWSIIEDGFHSCQSLCGQIQVEFLPVWQISAKSVETVFYFVFV